MTNLKADKLSQQVLLIPIVHRRSEYYKNISIPGNMISFEDGTLLSSVQEGTPRKIAGDILNDLQESPTYKEFPENELIVGPFKTASIKKTSANTYIYRADLLVAENFPQTLVLLGKTAILTSTKSSALNISNPEYKDWLPLTLLSPFDKAIVDYTFENYSYKLSCKKDSKRESFIRSQMEAAHIGI